MRTAICFSGHLRSFDTTFNYLKDTVIRPMNADVFIHTWDTIGSLQNRHKGDGDAEHFKINLEHVKRTANPVSMSVETESNKFIEATSHISIPEEDKMYIAGHIGFHVGMFYSIFKANQLKCDYEKLNNFTYDRVIRFRPDIRMGTTFNPKMFPDNNKLYIPEIGKYTEEGMNDQVAVGSSKTIDIYSNTYNNIIEYYSNHVTVLRPEMILKHHLTKNQVIIQDVNIVYDIYRFDGSILRQSRLEGFDPGARWK